MGQRATLRIIMVLLYDPPMTDAVKVRCGRRRVLNPHAHLILVTKYRRGVFTDKVLADLRGIFAAVFEGFGAKSINFGRKDRRVHLPIHYSPQVTVFILANSFKAVAR